jgi:hypothetical protein
VVTVCLGNVFAYSDIIVNGFKLHRRFLSRIVLSSRLLTVITGSWEIFVPMICVWMDAEGSWIWKISSGYLRLDVDLKVWVVVTVRKSCCYEERIESMIFD